MEQLERMVLKDLKVIKEIKELKVILVYKDQLVPQEEMDQRVILAPWDLKEIED